MGPIWPLQKRAKFGPPFRAILAPHSRADLAPLVAKLAPAYEIGPLSMGSI